MNPTEMWAALERYQRFAERYGFGAEWLRMTTERTADAAWRAADAAWSTVGRSELARVRSKSVTDAAGAAALAAEALCSLEKVKKEYWSGEAAGCITRAIEKENKA